MTEANKIDLGYYMKNNQNCVSDSHKPSLRETLEAIRAHNDARSGMAPSAELERLRHLADQLYCLVIESYAITAKDSGSMH